jgi:hypothetical protein
MQPMKISMDSMHRISIIGTSMHLYWMLAASRGDGHPHRSRQVRVTIPSLTRTRGIATGIPAGAAEEVHRTSKKSNLLAALATSALC